MKFLHILPNEGKFLDQLIRSTTGLDGTESRYLLFPKWLAAGMIPPFSKDVQTPTTESEFSKSVKDGCDWADAILVHGMTPQAGRALNELPDSALKNKTLVWTIWGFDILYADPETWYENVLPMTWIEMARAGRIGFTGHLPLWNNAIKAPRKSALAKNFDRAIHWNLAGPRALHLAKSIFKQSPKTTLPDWMSKVGPRIDIYTALEPYPELETNISGFRAKWHPGFPYYSMSACLAERVQNSGSRRHILVGGRAIPTGNHIDTLQLLKGRIARDQKIYLPLNYGDTSYADLVAQHAMEIFPTSSVPLRNWMPIGEYSQLLSNMGSVLMNQVRGQSLGTELLAMALGARLYNRTDNLHARYFRQLGLITCSIEEPDDLDQLDKPLTAEAVAHNKGILAGEWSDTAVRRRVSELYQVCRDQVGAKDRSRGRRQNA